MLKSLSIGIKLLKSKFINFKSNVQGMFLLITFLLLIPILVYISFVIDGSGMMLDRAQFNRGIEQSALFLTAENNFTRTTPNPALDKTSKNNRNEELMANVARYYYRQGNIGTGNDTGNKSLKDGYSYDCKQKVTPDNYDKGNNYIDCAVKGFFYRKSWLFLGKKHTYEYRGGALYGFKEYQKIGSVDSVSYKDTTPSKPPLHTPRDTIIIVDKTPNTWQDGYQDAITKTLTDLISALLPDDSYSRVGIMIVDDAFRFFGLPHSWYWSTTKRQLNDTYLPDGSKAYWDYVNNIQYLSFPVPGGGYRYSAEQPMEQLKRYYFYNTVNTTPKPTRVRAIEEQWWTGTWIPQSFGWIYPNNMHPPQSSRCRRHTTWYNDQWWFTLCWTRDDGLWNASHLFTYWRFNKINNGKFFDYLLPLPHALQMLTNYNRGGGDYGNGNGWLKKLKVNLNRTIIYVMNPRVVEGTNCNGNESYFYCQLYRRNQRVFKNGDICRALRERLAKQDLMYPNYRNYNPDTGNLSMYVISTDTWLTKEDEEAFRSCMGKDSIYYNNNYQNLIRKLLSEDQGEPYQDSQDSSGTIK